MFTASRSKKLRFETDSRVKTVRHTYLMPIEAAGFLVHLQRYRVHCEASSAQKLIPVWLSVDRAPLFDMFATELGVRKGVFAFAVLSEYHDYHIEEIVFGPTSREASVPKESEAVKEQKWWDLVERLKIAIELDPGLKPGQKKWLKYVVDYYGRHRLLPISEEDFEKGAVITIFGFEVHIPPGLQLKPPEESGEKQPR